MTPSLRFYFSILDKIAPQYAANKVYHVLSNPRQRKLRDFEDEVLNKSEQEIISFKNFQIQTYRWGKDNSRKAICVHGWEGQAGNFGAIVNMLVDKDFEVFAVDAPAHGYSSRGDTSMFEYIELVTQIAKEEKPEIIISHSFGSVVTAGVLRRNPDIEVKDWIMVTTPHNFRERILDVSKALNVTYRTVDRLIKLIEDSTGEHIDDLNMSEFTRDLPNLDQALIIHSKQDKILPIETSRMVHETMPKSELIELENLGHYKILWADEVISIIKERIT